MSEESLRRRITECQSQNEAASDSERRGRFNPAVAPGSENDPLVNRFNVAEAAVEQERSPARRWTELEAELSRLRLEIAEREESLAEKEVALNQLAGNFRTKIQTLQFRLQNTEAKLASRETELKEKTGVIEAAAARERAIGKLVVRLSSECEKLTAELYQKSLIIAQLEEKARHPIASVKVWKKVLGLLPEEPL